MARHEGKKDEKPKMEHVRKRARGGSMPKDTDEQEHEELEASEKEERKHGGEAPKRHKRKSGGSVPGKSMGARPDRKGGGTAEAHPFTAAGKMTRMPFERDQAANTTEAAGPDKD